MAVFTVPLVPNSTPSSALLPVSHVSRLPSLELPPSSLALCMLVHGAQWGTLSVTPQPFLSRRMTRSLFLLSIPYFSRNWMA